MGVALLGVTLVAAACGGDDGDGATAGTVDAGVKEGVSAAVGGDSTGASTTTVPQPTSMEEWEELWATQRAAIVDRITENGWGKSADGTSVTGPEGFSIDLTACAPGWSDTEGVSDTEVKIGQALPLSGTYADYGNVAKAVTVVFDYYGDQGAFTDSTGKNRRVNYIFKDDGYDPARTVPLVDELVDSEKVFAVLTLGSANGFKVYDKLNQRCIPHPFELSGHPAWGDPVNHPWTTGLQLAYTTEAILWGTFIEQHAEEFDGEITVAALQHNNDFGASYDAGFRAWMAQSPLKDRINYVTEAIEPQAPTVTDPMTTLAAQDPNVLIGMLAGTACTQMITEAAANGMKEEVEYLFQPSVCSASSFVGKDKVGGDGSATNGWWIVNGGVKDLNDPTQADDPFIKWSRELLQENGIDPASSGSLGSGMAWGFALTQSLRIAGELPGGLTRTNFITALRTFDMTNAMLLPGIGFNMEGNKDAYFIEGGVYQTYNSELQGWESQGEIIDLSGKSSTCAWDLSASVCQN
ncbi:MAG: ABC transporter substrate-binding protein [Acidimicrobiia bacterium]|nr:ABC transporter substrate-binding protein [Acidimicrobiia bacterium]